MAAGDSFNAAIEESMTTLQDRFTATHSTLDDRLAEHVGREEFVKTTWREGSNSWRDVWWSLRRRLLNRMC